MAETTTIPAAFEHLRDYFTQLQGRISEGSQLKIRDVLEGENLPGAAPVPHINLRIQKMTPRGRADRNKVWAIQVGVQVRSEITASDGAHAEILSKIALIQNHLDAYVKPDGVQGLDDSEWSISFPSTSESGNQVHADSIVTMSVVVAPNEN